MPEEAATPRQLDYIRTMGGEDRPGLTKTEASGYIEELDLVLAALLATARYVS